MLHALRWECKQLHNQTFAYVNDSSWLRFLALAAHLDGLSREMCSTARWIDSTWWYPQTDLPANENTTCTVLLRCISVSSLVDCDSWQWLWLWLPWRLVSNVMTFKVILGLPQRRAKWQSFCEHTLMTQWGPIDLMREVICITESSVLVASSSSQPVLGRLGRPSIRYVCMCVCMYVCMYVYSYSWAEEWFLVFGHLCTDLINVLLYVITQLRLLGYLAIYVLDSRGYALDLRVSHLSVGY